MDAAEIQGQFGQDLLRNLFRCQGCGECIKNCPVTPEGITVADLNYASTSEIELNSKITMFSEACLGCGHCSRHCPHGVERHLLMLAIKGRGPKSDTFQVSSKRIQKQKTAKRPEKKLSAMWETFWSNKLPESSAPLLFFLGCNVVDNPEPAVAAIKIAKRLNSDFAVLGGGVYCCGQKHRLHGDTTSALTLENELVQAIEKINPRRIVTGCGHCLRALIEIDHKGTKSKFEAMSLEAWLWKNRKRLEFEKSDDVICYLPSCEKKRSSEIGSKQILEMTASNVEMLPDDPERFDCCGSNGRREDFDKFLPHHLRVLEQAEEAGATALLLDCVSCFRPYNEAAAKKEIRVTTIVQWVLDCMKSESKEEPS